MRFIANLAPRVVSYPPPPYGTRDGQNKPTPFAVLAVRRDKPPEQNMAVTLRARNSVSIKVIF